MASNAKCLACGKRIGRELRRYRLTLVEPGQHTVWGKSVAWLCERHGAKFVKQLSVVIDA